MPAYNTRFGATAAVTPHERTLEAASPLAAMRGERATAENEAEI